MAVPTVPGFGAVASSGGATVNVSWPTGHAINDIGILIIEASANGATLTPATGWTAVAGTPAIDVATAAGSKLHVWWKRATSTAEAAVPTGALGDHILARLFTVRGCTTVGTPFDAVVVGSKTTASTTATVPAITVTLPDSLVMMIVGRPDDNASTTHFGLPVNSNLTNIVEHAEQGTITGNGGGFVVSSGTATIIGNIGTSTLTKTASTTDTYVVLAFRPELAIEATTQSYTWIRPTGLLQAQFRLNKTVGSFAYSGTSTGLNFNLSLNLTTGAYSVVGNNSLLQQALLLSGTTSTFNAQAVNADISANRILNQQQGAYVINGISVDLTYVQNLVKQIDAVVGVFDVTGNSAALQYQRIITGQVQSYAVSGTATGLLKNLTVNTTVGTFNVTGNSTLLQSQWIINGQSQSYAVSGTTTGLLKSLAVNAIPGTFTVAGNSAGLSFARTLDVTSGGFAVVGYNLGLNKVFQLSTSNGGFTVQGQDAVFSPTQLPRLLDAQVGSFNIFNLPAEITKRYPLTANNAAFVLNTPDIDYFADRNLKAVTGQLDIYVQDGSNLFTYLTNKPTILPKATPTRRNQWVYGRFTHMGRRFL